MNIPNDTLKKFIYIAALFVNSFHPHLSRAQFRETIQTDRPGQAIGPLSVGKNILQVQAGIDAGGDHSSVNSAAHYFNAHNASIRYGVTELVEINASIEYRADKYRSIPGPYGTRGLSLASFGARLNIAEGNGHSPAIGLQLSFDHPALSPAYDHKYLAPEAKLVIKQDVNDRLSLLCNTGISYNGDNARPTGLYVVNLGYVISNKIAAFAEGYGSFDDNGIKMKWDTGLGYLLNNDLQLDAYGGMSNNNGLFEYFASIGISVRIRTSNKTMNGNQDK